MSKPDSALGRAVPGATASVPKEIPKAGWLQVTKRAWAEAKADQVPLLAAGVAFYSFLSLFPAMIAAVTIYGLVADPQTVTRQTEAVSNALPEAAADIVTGQMEAIASQPQQALGLGLIVAVGLALWSAAGGVGNLVTAVNIAYDEEETRGFVKRKALSLGLTFGAVVFVVVAVTLIAVVPVYLEAVIPEGALRVFIESARWIGLLIAVAAALAILYRYAPDRDAPRLSWVSVGASVATVIWIVASLGFSLYVDNFGSYSETYGALAGVAILMLWLWITAFVVLLGAEINAEAEQQTIQDSTVGEPRPLGQRGAVKADTVPQEQPAGKNQG
ncbi:MAG TPA: YihY/virulence factor BrkB family protein [Nocardioidaceae bacterium]|nr:YihY/virulence factor BrkB family protein [Nocardioidaceae bacterium]